MVKEVSLLKEYKTLRVEESNTPGFYNFDEEIRKTWERFKEKNPNARDDPKLRLNFYEDKGDTLVVHLGRGVSFANVIYSHMLCQERNSPSSPEGTYEFTNGRYFAKLPYSNVVSIMGVILFNPNQSYDINDPDLKTILSIRSKRAATNPGALGVLVNGYVDVKDYDQIDECILEENLLRETEEESYLTIENISNIEFIGPSQTRGFSCDLAWILLTNLSYEMWVKKWIERGGQEESRGIFPIKISEINRINKLEEKIKLISKDGILSNGLRKDLEGGNLPATPLLEDIYNVLANGLQKYLDRMKR